MKRWKKISWILFTVLLSGGLAYYFTRPKEETFTWRTQTLRKGNIKVTVTATGPVNPLQTVQVGTQVSGTIARLLADFNSKVRKGQLIALIDTTLLAAAKDDAEAMRLKAEIQLTQMKKEFDRADKLYKEGAVPQADYDIAYTNYHNAISNVTSSKAQLSRAKINLRYATIYAPINGVVISRNVDVGQTVVASFNTPTLFSIANDLSKMQVYANVDEADIGQVKVGQKVDFTVDAFPDMVFAGRIGQVRLQPSVIQNVVNYTVLIDVENKDLKLLPGLTANISILVNEHDNVLRVPVNALHFSPPANYHNSSRLNDSLRKKITSQDNGKKYVWLKQGAEIYPIEVATGLSDGSYTEISGNVKAGDEIVLGVDHEGENKTQSTKNPFMPSFQRPKKM
jgi:HlyD family secretion protein